MPIAVPLLKAYLGHYSARSGQRSFSRQVLAPLDLPEQADTTKQYAQEILGPISLVESLALFTRRDPLPIHDLGLGPDDDDLLALAMLCLFLREEDAHFRALFRSVESANPGLVLDCTRKVLRRLRFHLQTSQADRGLFQSLPASSATGFEPYARELYSHCCREALFFLACNVVLRERLRADSDSQGMLGPAHVAQLTFPVPASKRLGIAIAVIGPTSAALNHLDADVRMSADQHLEYDPALATHAAAAQPWDSMAPTGPDTVRPPLQPLLVDNPILRDRIVDVVRLVRHAEGRDDVLVVGAPKGAHALFADLLRLKFALCLLTFCTCRRVNQVDHADELARLFPPEFLATRPQWQWVADALQYLRANRREPWGQGETSFAKRLQQALDAALEPGARPPLEDSVRRAGQEDVVHLLAGIEARLPATLRFGAVRAQLLEVIAESCASGSPATCLSAPRNEREKAHAECLLMHFWSTLVQESLDSAHNLARGEIAAVRTQLASLQIHLAAQLVGAPDGWECTAVLMSLCVQLANRALEDESGLPDPGPGGDWLTLHRQIAEGVRALVAAPPAGLSRQELWLALSALTFLESLQGPLAAARHAAMPEHAQGKQAGSASKVDPSGHEQVREFFSRVYADNGASAEQWLFVAHASARALADGQDGEITVYQEIFDHVADFVRTESPPPLGARLQPVYRSMRECAAYHDALDFLREALVAASVEDGP